MLQAFANGFLFCLCFYSQPARPVCPRNQSVRPAKKRAPPSSSNPRIVRHLKLPLQKPKIVIKKGSAPIVFCFLLTGGANLSHRAGIEPSRRQSAAGRSTDSGGRLLNLHRNDKSAYYPRSASVIPNAAHASVVCVTVNHQAQYDAIMRALAAKKTPPQNTRSVATSTSNGNGSQSDWTWAVRRWRTKRCSSYSKRGQSAPQ